MGDLSSDSEDTDTDQNYSADECSEESEEDETKAEYEDVMLPGSGDKKERIKNSRQFRANLDALFRSVYEDESEKRIEEIKSLV